MEYDLHGFVYEKIVEECEKFKTSEEKVDYLNYVIMKWITDEPEIDPNGETNPLTGDRFKILRDHFDNLLQKELKQKEGTKKKPQQNIKNQVKEYIAACKTFGIEAPSLKQLSDCTGFSIDIWKKLLATSSFWHLLKDEVVHSINQAKKEDARIFWVTVKQYSENKYADLFIKEIKNREKNINDLSQDKQSRF